MRAVVALFFVALASAVSSALVSSASEANRLTYLDAPCDPYYVGRDFPKLTTPQWVGEEGVEAVVVLSIDDMRDTAKYEAYLRPILDRLKQIDGRAPVSIMTCSADRADPQLAAWLEEGVSIEAHTVDHPCPLLKGGDFAKAKSTYDRCVDRLSEIPGSRPVAFRMPCCDSRNTPSPRVWSEIFNRTTEKGNYLSIDSSVFNVTTARDRDLPRELVLDERGEERFRRYIPFPSFVNTIEDYPYPYVIGRLCWQFPCMVPSDWSAQHVQRPNNPDTVRDLKLALDATVIKKGVFNFVFHPHGWIRNDQIVELIDHAVEKHGPRVKFLTFRESLGRLNTNLLDGRPLRRAEDGGDNRVRLLDVNADGYMDVVRWGGNSKDAAAGGNGIVTKLWDGEKREWRRIEQSHYLGSARRPIRLVEPRFGRRDSTTWLVQEAEGDAADDFLAAWFTDQGWTLADVGQFATAPGAAERKRHWHASDARVIYSRLVDVDGDGTTELLRAKPDRSILLGEEGSSWKWLPFGLPPGTSPITERGGDAGLRLVDVDRDGRLDVLFSNAERYSLHLFKSIEEGWSIRVIEGERDREGGVGPVIPPIVRRDGTNGGVWFHSGQMWVQNEQTDRLPDGVDRLSFADMLKHHHREEDEQGNLPWPRSPDASLASIEVPPGFEVELVAAEPLVADPVAFDWTPDGRLWVAEMHDYPNGLDWHKPGDPLGTPGGRIKLLSDTDGDGRYDKADLFLDGVPFPTGVKSWRGGVLITAAPEILYAEDTDGDGRADKRLALYRGFGEGNQQHRVNGLRWGLDNWLHLANGDSGGRVKSLSSGREVDIGGRDVRIRPDDGLIETTSGKAQFGRNRDDWGNWFGGNNSEPMWHYVLADHYLGRNPHFAPPDVRKRISVQPGTAPVFPVSRTLARFNHPGQANRFTSACSPMIYRDELLLRDGLGGQATDGDAVGHAFICEPVHNLVHREIVTRDGVSFSSRRAAGEQSSEFFASRDNWCRPVMVRTGPDGALWIADMVRLVVEHPKWIPETWQEKVDLRAGDTMGRIYRVKPIGSKLRPVPRLDRLDPDGLVGQLENPNGPVRDMAQQMLVWQGGKAAVPALERMVRAGARPTARLHALCTLDGLGALRQETVAAALGDPHPGVRRHAIRLSEPFVDESEEVQQAWLRATGDADASVRLQVACSLGAWTDGGAAGPALARMALAHRDDPYVRAGLMTSLNRANLAHVLAGVVKAGRDAPHDLIEPLISMAAAIEDESARNESINGALLSMTGPASGSFEAWQLAAVARLLDALDRRKLRLDDVVEPDVRPQVQRLFDEARRRVGDAGLPPADRLPAVLLLARGLGSREKDVDTLAALVGPGSPPELQSAAVDALARLDGPRAPPLLLAGWRSHSPRLRARILDALLSRAQWTEVLLSAIERGPVGAAHLDARRRQQLLRHDDEATRARAKKLLAASTSADRQAVLARYETALSIVGSVDAGRALFGRQCAKCHRLEGAGHLVGPDLAALTDRSPRSMLVAILDPNRAVEDKYVDYTVVNRAGRQSSGVLTSETANSIVLSGPEGKSQTVLRTDIEQLAATGKSMMPEGVERDLARDLADVIAYVQSVGSPPKKFPGNEPRVAPVGDDGSIRCPATHARIYGPSLVFEEKYRNLGFWGSDQDQAVWSIVVPKAGTYRVAIDYACDNSVAGNRFRVEVAGETVGDTVKGTGTWDDYRTKTAGQVELGRGPADVSFRSDGAVNRFLIDLREIVLTPVDVDSTSAGGR